MDPLSSSSRCPGCARPLDPGRAQGLCPRCLLARAAFGTGPEPSGPTVPPPSVEAVAAAFPQLEVTGLIGRGGMGVVYRARQKSLDRWVALKLLAPGREQDPAFAERFAREARALAALNHPSIVTVHDFGFASSPSAGEPGGFYFLLMEFVDGVNLRQAMQAGRFTPEQALAIVPPVCAALQFAHERGIVHRDIKPENLLLDKDGRVKIADFGIAKMLGAAATGPGPGPVDAVATPDAPVSVAGPTQVSAAGTPQYMAPEQREAGGRSDHRADIYSLGVVLYELLTGELPGARLEPPSHKVQIDVRLDEIVLRALAVRPEMRFATAGDFRAQLDTVTSTPRPGSYATAAPSAPRPLRSTTAILTTPEALRTLEGQFFAFRSRGQLVLDEQRLTHLRDGDQTVIPLAAVRDVSIEQYPRGMNPAGIHFVGVRYEEAGQIRHAVISPMKGLFALPSTWNALVAEWHRAIRDAVTSATGKEPGTTPCGVLPGPVGTAGIRTFTVIASVVPMLTFFFTLMMFRSPRKEGEGIHLLLFLLAMVAGGIVARQLLWSWFQKPEPAGPVTFGPWCRAAGTLMVIGALAGGAALTANDRSKAHAEAAEAAVRLKTVQMQEAAVRVRLHQVDVRSVGARTEAERIKDGEERDRLGRERDALILSGQAMERAMAQGKPRRTGWAELLPVLPLALAGLWLFVRSRPPRGTQETSSPGMRWLGAALLSLGLLTGGVGVWLGIEVSREISTGSGWNPTPAEAFFTFAIWMLSIGSLVGGSVAMAFARPRSGTGGLRRDTGTVLLVLGGLCPATAVAYLATALPTYLATSRFQIDDTQAWLGLPALWERTPLGRDPALRLVPIRLTRLFELRATDITPEGALGRAEEAFQTLRTDKIGAGLLLIDRPVKPIRPVGPNNVGVMTAAILGCILLGLPGLWLIGRRGLLLVSLGLLIVMAAGGAASVLYLTGQPATPMPTMVPEPSR